MLQDLLYPRIRTCFARENICPTFICSLKTGNSNRSMAYSTFFCFGCLQESTTALMA